MMGLEGRREEGPLKRLHGAAGASEPAHSTYRASSARRLRRARRGSPPGRELWQCGCRLAHLGDQAAAGKDSPTPAREPAPPWSRRPGGDRGRARASPLRPLVLQVCVRLGGVAAPCALRPQGLPRELSTPAWVAPCAPRGPELPADPLCLAPGHAAVSPAPD